ncbi:MAG: GMC oxidoreductase, partial [Methyloceanibacter sp.]
YQEQARGELYFPRSYHYELGAAGRGEPSLGMGDVADFAGNYGRKLKQDMRRNYGSFLSFTCRGEMIPNAGSYCEIDPETKVQWGIPTLRFHFKWSEHELNMVRHFQKTTKDLIERLGGTINWGDVPAEEAISKGGEIIHEVGTTRMDDDPGASVLLPTRRGEIPDGQVPGAESHLLPRMRRPVGRSGGETAREKRVDVMNTSFGLMKRERSWCRCWRAFTE